MADLRDRYRRDYRSVPIPTPPRAAPPRKPIQGPLPQGSSPSLPPQDPLPTTTSAPQQPVAVAVPQKEPLLTPPTPQPIAPPQPQQPVPGLIPASEQPQALPESKRQAKASKRAQKKADKRGGGAPKRSRKKWLLIPILIIILAGLGASGAYAYQHVKALGIPTSYVKTSPFPIYYPVSLPGGYYVDTASITNQDNALVFTIRNSSDKNKSVAVSEQALPTNFNPDKQLPDPVDGETGVGGSYTTAAGKGEVGQFQGKQVATLASSKTWIIMNVSAIPSSDIPGIASSFQRIGILPYAPIKQVYILKKS